MARTGNVNLCVRTNPRAAFRPAGESAEKDIAMYQDEKVAKGFFLSEYDLINRAEGPHYYVFEVNESMDFERFKEEMKARKLAFSKEKKSVAYSLYDAVLEYSGAFTVGGKEFVPDFRRPREYAEKWF